MVTKSKSARNNKADSLQGIVGVSVEGYKSIYEECVIDITPLTILAGANSSGKSSIMQPILLMKQTLEATYDPGSLLLNGSNVRFTLSEQLLSKFAGKNKTQNFKVGINLDGNKAISNIFSKHPTKAIEVTQTTCQENEKKFIVTSKMNRESVIDLLAKRYENTDLENIFLQREGDIVEKLEWVVVRTRCFLNIECKSLVNAQVGTGKEYTPIRVNLYDSSSRTSLFESHIRKLIHVPGLRGNPERSYKTTAVGQEFSGTFENYVASIINYWQETKDQRLKNLGNDLKTLGLTWKVDAQKIDDTQVELRVGRLPKSAKGGTQDMVNIADVGFGVSQTLPVLVALLVADPGQLVYLEQPEIHLHPRAQASLAKILVDAANRGVRVVVETHSNLLLTRMQTLVAEGAISTDKVKLHWFQRREDGVTEVKTAELDETGAFGDWPIDFDEVALEEESRYLNAAESRLLNS